MADRLARTPVRDVLLQSMATFIDMAGIRLGMGPAGDEARDLAQARQAIEALRALLGVAERELGAAQVRPFKEPLAVLQMAYARAAEAPANGPPVLGWVGSPTTRRYLLDLSVPLRALARRQRFRLRVAGAGHPVALGGVSVDNVPWSLPGEVALFNGCDIGLYPLPDDEWTRGKCGFKAIQFMACGVPVVASAVGALPEIVGAAGLLVEPRDPGRLATALRTIWTDDRVHGRVAAAAADRAATDHRSWADVADATRRVYAEVGIRS